MPIPSLYPVKFTQLYGCIYKQHAQNVTSLFMIPNEWRDMS